jgi:hypothetical protein
MTSFTSRITDRLRQQPALLIPLIAALLIVLAIAWWLGSPLFLNTTVNEAFPLSADATLPAGMPQADAEATMVAAAAVTTTAEDALMPAEAAPVALLTGVFRDGDSFHRGSGTATIYRLADGSHVLRLDEFEVTNGPDLHVYLSAHRDPEDPRQATGDGYLDLGQLKGNVGAQNYVIPEGVDLAQFNSVVIYCQPFHVVFSVAPLAG